MELSQFFHFWRSVENNSLGISGCSLYQMCSPPVKVYFIYPFTLEMGTKWMLPSTLREENKSSVLISSPFPRRPITLVGWFLREAWSLFNNIINNLTKKIKNSKGWSGKQWVGGLNYKFGEFCSSNVSMDRSDVAMELWWQTLLVEREKERDENKENNS